MKKTGKLGREIERRWILAATPNLEGAAGTAISQGYLSDDPEAALRLRRKSGNGFFIALKGAGSLERLEWETTIPEWVFEKLWSKVDGRIIEKVRYDVPHGDYVLEVNIYTGRFQGLIMVEVEFADLESARSFILPLPEAIEVTDDEAYQNFNLAVHGWPSAIQSLHGAA